jgi:uncharacterized protein YqjF (DUF2071 family)
MRLFPKGMDSTATFTRESLMRPPARWCDVVTRLRHFAIVTYAIPPERLRPLVDPRFDLDCIVDGKNGRKAMVSMVPFEDQDFHFAGCPWARFHFGQTNYRAYVVERDGPCRAVWFFGTTLGSWTVHVPRQLWKLPWHPGRMRFDCAYDAEAVRYGRYAMHTSAEWAPVELELEDTGRPVERLDGFPDLERGLFILTHPLRGYFHRRDGRLGAYNVWHDRLRCTSARVRNARIGLFDRLGLVPYDEQLEPHSVLVQPLTEFTIYLPPRPVP